MMVSEIQPSSLAANGAVSPIQAQPMAEGRAVLALEGMTCASCAMRIFFLTHLLSLIVFLTSVRWTLIIQPVTVSKLGNNAAWV